MSAKSHENAPFILNDEGHPLTVWRGESSGIHYQHFDMSKTNCQSGFFFAEEKQQADQYAARGTDARPFHLCANSVLDLTDPYAPGVLDFIKRYAAEFDDWTDRFSGEPADVATLLETGYLYDYEGTGTGTRWNHLFRFASGEGYDAVCVLDATDGLTAPVWVVFDPEQITHAEAPTPTMDTYRKRKGWG